MSSSGSYRQSRELASRLRSVFFRSIASWLRVELGPPQRHAASRRGQRGGQKKDWTLLGCNSMESQAFSRFVATDMIFGATGGRDGFRVSPRPSMPTWASGYTARARSRVWEKYQRK